MSPKPIIKPTLGKLIKLKYFYANKFVLPNLYQ